MSMFTPSVADSGNSLARIVCPRYEVIYEYLRVRNFQPLTNLEQRAFLYLLDLECDEEMLNAHSEDCVCMDILPTIVQFLEPDPVDCVVAERNLENETCPARRFHTEKINKNQGIVLGMKTKREHTDELRNLAQRLLKDFDVVFAELRIRMKSVGYSSERAMIENEFPKIVEFMRAIQKADSRRRNRVIAAEAMTPVSRGKVVREHFDALRKQIEDRHAESVKEAVRRLEEQRKQNVEKIEQAAALVGDIELAANPEIAMAAVKPAPKKRKPVQTPGGKTVRASVLEAIKDWANIEAIAAATGIPPLKVRGVLNASDLRDQIEKRKVEGSEFLEYRQRPDEVVAEVPLEPVQM